MSEYECYVEVLSGASEFMAYVFCPSFIAVEITLQYIGKEYEPDYHKKEEKLYEYYGPKSFS